ncbi:MAG: peptidase C60, sortase A and B [uncultured Rubrobacteraceae bacterium]|uniref:Peptidase C60, sortase A and B n=1 Tax=uncultured Rubrobacteraceae bacterium TaxID=349277 RepID=A0A6J4RFZ6_9ACTN|nr:MAG: peptidase C60, sortase A and B [uncultured Rubrobacteraceae bacterium]
MRTKLRTLILTATAVAMVAILAACGGGTDAPDSANAPDEPKKPEQRAEPGAAAEAPEDETLRLTVPKMARLQDDEIPTTVGNDEAALKDYAAIHLEGTGFPWEEEANVYIAGHRLGYPNTDSFLAFWDLDALEDGDEITVTDANGKEYVYEVFEEFDVAPTDLYVLDPVPGKNILTLQTCTLPDYSRRLIVQAELKS